MIKALFFSLLQLIYFVLISVPLAILLMIIILVTGIFKELKTLIWGKKQLN